MPSRARRPASLSSVGRDGDAVRRRVTTRRSLDRLLCGPRTGAPLARRAAAAVDGRAGLAERDRDPRPAPRSRRGEGDDAIIATRRRLRAPARASHPSVARPLLDFSWPSIRPPTSSGRCVALRPERDELVEADRARPRRPAASHLVVDVAGRRSSSCRLAVSIVLGRAACFSAHVDLADRRRLTTSVGRWMRGARGLDLLVGYGSTERSAPGPISPIVPSSKKTLVGAVSRHDADRGAHRRTP